MNSDLNLLITVCFEKSLYKFAVRIIGGSNFEDDVMYWCERGVSSKIRKILPTRINHWFEEGAVICNVEKDLYEICTVDKILIED